MTGIGEHLADLFADQLSAEEADQLTREDLTVCCGCLALVPWLYLDCCEDCIGDDWTPEIRAQFRSETGDQPYSMEGRRRLQPVG